MGQYRRKLTNGEGIKYVTKCMEPLLFMLEGKPDLEKLNRVFTAVAKTEPYFYLTIKKRLFAYFLEVDTKQEVVFNFEILTRKDDSSAEEYFSKITNANFDEGVLYQAFIILPEDKSKHCDYELILVFNHAFSDGISLCYSFILRALMAYEANDIDLIKPYKDLTFPLSKDYYLAKHKDVKRNSPFKLLARYFTQRRDKFNFISKATSDERKQHIKSACFSKQVFDKVIAFCRQHEYTVNEIFVFICYQVYAENFYTSSIPIEILTPISVRDLIDNKDDQMKMSYFVNGLITNHAPSASNIDKFIQNYRKQLKTTKAVESFGIFSIPCLMKFMLNKIINHPKKQGRAFDLMISNIGKLPFKQTYADMTIKDYLFTVANRDIGSMYSCGLGTEMDGQIRFVFIYVTPLSSHDDAQLFLDKFSEKLTALPSYTHRT